MKAIELFAGAGGLGIGVARAGFSHEAIIEWNRDACETIRDNQRHGVTALVGWPEIYEGDVRSFDYRPFGDKIDLVAGGPPCQPFSLGGKHRAYLDDRDMWPEATRAIRELRPRAFVFENVRGLVRETFSVYFEYILLRLAHPEDLPRKGESWREHHDRIKSDNRLRREPGLEYRVFARTLNAVDYGVPQRRERVFIVGFRSDLGIEWSFPEATHAREALLWSQWVSADYWEKHQVPKSRRPKPEPRLRRCIEDIRGLFPPRGEAWRTVRDAIADLPEPDRKDEGTNAVSNHRFQPGARSYPGHTGSPLDEPAKTLKAGVHGVPGGENMVLLPDGRVRYYTVREAARLQTFPDDYRFMGAWGECMRQIGNAVPVGLAQLLAESLRSALDYVPREGHITDAAKTTKDQRKVRAAV